MANADIDSKLRVRENGVTYAIAGSTNLATSTSFLHMRIPTGIISVLYVLPTDPLATKTIIKLANGTKKALKKFISTTLFPNKSTTGIRHCYAPQRISGYISIVNSTPTDAVFVLATSTLGTSPSGFTVNANSTSSIEMGVIPFSQNTTSCNNDNINQKPIPGPSTASYYVYQNGILVANPTYRVEGNSFNY